MARSLKKPKQRNFNRRKKRTKQKKYLVSNKALQALPVEMVLLQRESSSRLIIIFYSEEKLKPKRITFNIVLALLALAAAILNVLPSILTLIKH